jgi:hypothetical protein
LEPAQKGEREEARVVERLRLLARKGYGPSDFIGTCEAAADLIERLLSSAAAEGEMREALMQARQELWDALHSHMSETEFTKEVEYIDAALRLKAS